MTEGGFYQQKRLSPIGMATVFLLHGAAITALLTATTQIPISNPFKPIDIYNVPEPPPPPPRTVPQPPKPQSAQPDNSHPTAPPTPFPPFPTGPAFPPSPPLPPIPFGTGTLPEPPLPPAPPAARKFEPAHAHANLSSYVSDSDYPASAARNEEQGTTRFRLSVGADGRVTDCAVTASSGSSALDAATCRLMKSRARFTPARDSDGKAVADSVISAIRWVLPEG